MTTSAKRRAGRREHRADVREHLPRLRDDVVAADERAVAVDRHDAGDEEQVAGAHGVGVVADRLGQARDADLLAPLIAPSARSSLSVVRGVIASGSIRSSISAGLPAASARSSAAAKSSVSRRPVSPCAPKARA